MRVIAQHGWVDGNYLESAGDLRHRCQPLRDQINRLPERKGAGRGGEGVLDVDVTDERQLDVGRATRRNQSPLAAPGSESD